MNRRDTVYALAALATVSLTVSAQQSNKLPVIGFLNPGFAGGITGTASAFAGLISGLSSLGYAEGKTIRIEARWAQGKPEQLPALAQELIRLKVDLIVAVSPASVKAALAASKDLPIVAHDLETDPIAAGLIASLARPGANLTGLFLNHADLAAKWLEQITEVLPAARRLAVLWDANTGPYQLEAIKAAATAKAVQLSVLEFRGADGIQRTLDAGLKEKPDAIVQLGSPLIRAATKAIAESLAAQRVPGISPFREFAENGGLLSYGVNLPVMYRSLAPYISKILHGAKPGELPIEQPTHFEFLVNLKAARIMGIKIPPAVLARADEVIE